MIQGQQQSLALEMLAIIECRGRRTAVLLVSMLVVSTPAISNPRTREPSNPGTRTAVGWSHTKGMVNCKKTTRIAPPVNCKDRWRGRDGR